jgi:hypothetical protein
LGTNSFVNLPTVGVGYSSTVMAASPAELASFVTLGPLTEGGYANGQQANVAAVPVLGTGTYSLQPAVSSAPDSIYVIPTSDDPTRQWVATSILQGFVSVISAELDLTQVQNVELLPPLNYKVGTVLALAWIITQRDGTVSAGPTAQGGFDAGATDLAASTLNAAIATAAVDTRTVLAGGVAANSNLDASIGNGLVVKITSGAGLGSATVFKARVAATFYLYK